MNANPINYARGLLNELEMAVRAGLKDREAVAKAELAKVIPFLRDFEATGEAAELKDETLAAVSTALPASRAKTTK